MSRKTDQDTSSQISKYLYDQLIIIFINLVKAEAKKLLPKSQLMDGHI
jgi:hypothetical protein